MSEQAKKVHGTWSYPGKENERQWFNWWFLPLELLGMMGPLVGAMISLIVTIICLWLVKFANVIFQSELLALIIDAVSRNIEWFLIVPLVIGYCQYFAKKFYAGHIVCTPIDNAVGFTFSMWIIAWVFRTIGDFTSTGFLFQIGTSVRENLLLIFSLVLLLGYISVARAHLSRSR